VSSRQCKKAGARTEKKMKNFENSNQTRKFNGVINQCHDQTHENQKGSQKTLELINNREKGGGGK